MRVETRTSQKLKRDFLSRLQLLYRHSRFIIRRYIGSLRHRFIIVGGGTCTFIAVITLLDGCANNVHRHRVMVWQNVFRAPFLELWLPRRNTPLFLHHTLRLFSSFFFSPAFTNKKVDRSVSISAPCV